MGLKMYIKRTLRWIFKGVPKNIINLEIKTSTPTNVFTGRRILITGGSKGLGYAFAKMCSREGAQVVITGRNEKTLKEASDSIGELCHFIVCDITKVSDLPDLFLKAESLCGGKIDSVISNAGVSLHEGDFRNVSEEQWDKQIDINLKGNYFFVKSFIEYLESKEDKTGNIVVVTSERSRKPDDIPYGISKIATNDFIRCIASKVSKEGIRINGIGPGVTATDMTGVAKDGNYYCDWSSNGRFFIPEEMSEVVRFLLSDFSSCISGEIIVCDQASWVSHW